MTVAPSGDLVLAGDLHGQNAVDFGGGPLEVNSLKQAFVARLGADGSHQWSRAFGKDVGVTGYHVTADAFERVTITGVLPGAVDFGGGPIEPAPDEFLNTDAYVAAFDADGTPRWSLVAASSGWKTRLAMAPDPDGNLLVGGYCTDDVDLGGGPLLGTGLFIGKLDPDGEHLWSQGYPSGSGNDVASDAAGNLILAGAARETIDLGGGPLLAGDNTYYADIVVAKFDPAGNHLWSKRFGDEEAQYGTWIAADDAGNVFMLGDGSGTVDFGGGPLSSDNPHDDLFLAKFDPSGSHLWSRRIGGSFDQKSRGLAVDSGGNVILAAFNTGTIDFGGGPLEGQYVVAKLDPAGVHMWSKEIPGTFEALAVSPSCEVVLTGMVYYEEDFGGGPLGGQNPRSIFVAVLGP